MMDWLAKIRQMFLLMVGQPSYQAYLDHMRKHHPDQPVMDEVGFFRDREQARYSGKNGGRCC